MATKTDDEDEPSPLTLCQGIVVIIVGFLSFFLSQGPLYISGVYVDLWVRDFQVGYGTASWLGVLGMGVESVTGPVAATSVQLIGYKWTIAIGGAIGGASMIGSSYITNIYAMIFVFGILNGFGFGLLYHPILSYTTMSLGKYKSIGNAIVSCGAGAGSIVLSLFANWAIEYYGWRGSVLLTGAAALNIIPAAMAYIDLDKTETAKPLPDNEQVDLLQKTENKDTIRESGIALIEQDSQTTPKKKKKPKVNFHLGIFKRVNFLLYLLSVALMYFQSFIASVHVVPGSKKLLGLPDNSARYLMSVMGFSMLASRLGLGSMLQIPKVDVFTTYLLATLAGGLGTLLLPFCTSYAGLVICVIFMGVGFFPFGFVQLIILEILDERYLVVGFGYTLALGSIGLFLGAPSAGWLYDATHDYSNSMYLGGISMLLSVVLLTPGWIKHLRKKHGKTVPPDNEPEIRPTFYGSMLSVSSLYLDNGSKKKIKSCHDLHLNV